MGEVQTVSFREAKVGDYVMRVSIGNIPCPLRVSEIGIQQIRCGD